MKRGQLGLARLALGDRIKGGRGEADTAARIGLFFYPLLLVVRSSSATGKLRGGRGEADTAATLDHFFYLLGGK